MSFGSSKLSGRQPGERQQLEGSVKLLLLWVAESDGAVDAAELDFIDSQLPDTQGTVKSEELLAVIRAGDLKRIEAAIRTVARENRDLRLAFMDMAIAMCIADRDIATTENHILRFYADALFLGPAILQKRFQSISGQPLPEPANPGSRERYSPIQENPA